MGMPQRLSEPFSIAFRRLVETAREPWAGHQIAPETVALGLVALIAFWAITGVLAKLVRHRRTRHTHRHRRPLVGDWGNPSAEARVSSRARPSHRRAHRGR